jgi:hypothetical protein
MDESNVIDSEKNITRNGRERIENLGINCTSFIVAYNTINRAKGRGEEITDEYVTRTAKGLSLSLDQYKIAKNIFEDSSYGNEVVIPLPSPKVEVKLPTFMRKTEGKPTIHEVTARMILTKYAVDVLQKIDDENISRTITQDMIKDMKLSRDDQSKVIAAIDLEDKMKKEKLSPLSVTNSAFESMSDDISFRILMDEFEQKIRSEICREDYPEEMTGVILDFSKNSIDAVNDLLAVAQARNGKLKPSDIVDDLGFVKDSPVVSKFLSGVYLLNLVDDEIMRLEKLDNLTRTFVKQMNPMIADSAMRIGQPANDNRKLPVQVTFSRVAKVLTNAAAVLLISASNLFNGSAQKMDINTASFTGAFDIIETVLLAPDETYGEPSIFESNFSLLSPERPFDDANIIKPVIDVPVPKSRLSELSPMMASFERDAPIPEYATQSFQLKLSMKNIVGRVLQSYDTGVSSDMHEQLVKIDFGLSTGNNNIALMGAYDAMLMLVTDGKVDLAKKISELIVENDPQFETHAGQLAQEAQDNWSVVVANLAPTKPSDRRLALS